MGIFDTTARRAAKRNGAGFFAWTVPRLDPSLRFIDWLDARTAPAPPDSELTCDALAEFLTPGLPEQPWMAVAEFQTEPSECDLERLFEYMFRFRRERRPTSDPRLKYMVTGVILNLTGPKQQDALVMSVPGMPQYGMFGRVVRVAVRELDAPTLLSQIGAGKLDRCVLPWLPLMRGGGDSEVITEWKRLTDIEPNVPLRLQYAVDALVFAELPGVWTQWKQALEGWNVKVSQQVLEWQNEARAQEKVATRREDLLRLLENRCKASVPDDLAATIQGTHDMNLLSHWFDAAAQINNYDDMRKAMQSRP